MHYLDASFKKEHRQQQSGRFSVTISRKCPWSLIQTRNRRAPFLEKTVTTDNGYAPSMSADPFYADPASKLYPKIREIAFNRLKGEACKTLMLEVIVEDTAATKHLAYVQGSNG